MIEALILRLDAPLVSFGGIAVDNIRPTDVFPGLSMLAGLFGNALGYDHRDSQSLHLLQQRIRYAVRCDRPGSLLLDYQTANLGQSFMKEGWTASGKPEGRDGGAASSGIHIMEKHFWADAVFTIAITLQSDSKLPTLDHLASVIIEPARPLFLGRKACIPAEHLFLRKAEGNYLREILQAAPLIHENRRTQGIGEDGLPLRTVMLPARWPSDDPRSKDSRLVPVTDERDWVNRIHVGHRFVSEGFLECGERHG